MPIGVIDPNEHDRFIVARRQSLTATPSLGSATTYDFSLATPDGRLLEPVCHVRERVLRLDQRIGFYVDEARTVPLMYLNARPRFDPWARYKIADAARRKVGEIQKVFVRDQRCSAYTLFNADGDDVACVEARVPASVSRWRAGRVGVAAAAGLLGIPLVGAAGVAAVGALAGRAAVREVRARVDPLDVASELAIMRGGAVLGTYHRQRAAASLEGAMSTMPLPWRSASSVYEIDMSADCSRAVDRRLVLVLAVALDALRGLIPRSALS